MPHAQRSQPLGWLDLGPGWLFASIRDAVIVAEADTGQIALWNPAAAELFGFTEQETLGTALPDLIHDLRETSEWLAACAGRAERQVVELFGQHKSGADV